MNSSRGKAVTVLRGKGASYVSCHDFPHFLNVFFLFQSVILVKVNSAFFAKLHDLFMLLFLPEIESSTFSEVVKF